MPKKNYKHSLKGRPLPSSRRLPYEKVTKMNAKSNRQLVLGHAILHAWEKNPDRTNWSKEAIEKEHVRLVKLMKQKGFKHTTPLKFSKKWDEL